MKAMLGLLVMLIGVLLTLIAGCVITAIKVPAPSMVFLLSALTILGGADYIVRRITGAI